MPYPVDNRFIERAEEKLEIKFPSSYVAEMEKSNGGTMEAGTDAWVLYPIFDSSDKNRLKRTCNDVVRETAQAKEWAGFPSAGIAIGANGCGDQLIFLVSPDGKQLGDRVCWWDHETDAINPVADDFSQLSRAV
jgi:hypothetical protein